MANVAGRPNIVNEVLDENGRFTSVWYRFMEQMWVRSGGSDDDVSGLIEALELVELIPTTEDIPQGDLLPPVVEKEVPDDLAPRFEIDQDTLTAADIGNTVQAFSANLDTYAANSLTAAELGELQNINSVTITNAQWTFLGDFDQSLTTTDDVTFDAITGTGILSIDDTTESTSLITGSIHTDGGLGVAKALFSKSITIRNLTDISPTSAGIGQLSIQGNGFNGYIAMDANAMHIGHNSSGRDLILQTNETTRLTINGSTGNAVFAAAVSIGGDLTVTSGNEVFLNLPIVSTGTSGSLWNDSGTVKVVP